MLSVTCYADCRYDDCNYDDFWCPPPRAQFKDNDKAFSKSYLLDKRFSG
jgi:hypothetical protein